MAKKEFSKELIEDLYVNKQMSQREIAKKLEIGQTTVRRLMAKFNIPSRSQEDSRKTPNYLKRQQELANKYHIEYTKSYEKVCPQCNKTFFVDGSHQKQKYCCKKCSDNSLRIKYTCNLCGKQFLRPGHKRIYCDDCLNKWRTKVFTKKILINCAYCDKELEVIPSRANHNENCFCNRECMANYYSKNYSGENSPSWKGGKPNHYLGNFNFQRREARKRDEYTCQLCGISEEEYGQQLSVHHIRKYRLFDDKVEANKLDNLVSLCEPCHRFIHSNANIEKLYLNNN